MSASWRSCARRSMPPAQASRRPNGATRRLRRHEARPGSPARPGRFGAMAQRALHVDGVEPALELPARVPQDPDDFEAESEVQADRAGIGAVADDGDHLAGADRLTALDQLADQRAAGTAALPP